MVKVYPNAELDADFPDDAEEENGNITVFPGRNAAAAIAELLQQAGAATESPEMTDHGWEFSGAFKDLEFYIDLSTFEDSHFYMHVVNNAFLGRLLKSKKQKFQEILVMVNRALQIDPRFHAIKWFEEGDQAREVGQASPVEAV